jgi:predicted  nucleic acid-binding Zn-ribbon protein
MDERSNRPTLWIVLAGVCAVAAIGLLIWGLSTKSDLDDANARLADEQSTLSDQEREAAAAEAKEQAFGAQALRRFEAVRDRLASADKQVDELKSDVAREADQLTAARAAAASAQGRDEQLQARLEQARQEHELARACARSALGALNEFFDAADVQSGADKALKGLEDLQDECRAAVGDEA